MDKSNEKLFEGELVTIMSCTKCNANCEHCYISYEGNLEAAELYAI